MKKQKPEPPLVMIEWVDSVRPIAPWQLIKDFEAPEPVKCFSVGWLISETRDVKALAPNIGSVADTFPQACGIIQITKRSIIRQVKLKEGPKYKFTSASFK